VIKKCKVKNNFGRSNLNLIKQLKNKVINII